MTAPRRIGLATLASLAVGVAALAAPVESPADERVIAAPLSSGFLNPDVSIDQGERLTFLNPDIAPHDVTSVEPGLFASETVMAPSEVPVTGAESLGAGSYAFICSIHPGMTGTLTVGGGHEGHDTKGPRLSVKALDRKLSEVLEAGKLLLRVKLDEPAKVRAVATAGDHDTKVAKGKAKLDAGAGRVAARLTGAGKRMLKGSRKAELKLTLTAADASGNPSKLTAAATLR